MLEYVTQQAVAIITALGGSVFSLAAGASIVVFFITRSIRRDAAEAREYNARDIGLREHNRHVEAMEKLKMEAGDIKQIERAKVTRIEPDHAG